MHFTLHLTTECNYRCRYCYTPTDKPQHIEMDESRIDDIIRFAVSTGSGNIGMIFFGGEPLLKKDLIYYAVRRCREEEAKAENKFRFYFKITTNGYYLDEEFLKFSKEHSISIGLSIDGIAEAHNINRKCITGEDTFEILNSKLDMILKYQPYTNAMMVISPNNVRQYSESVKFLVERGFRYIIASLNYAGDWRDDDLPILERELEKIADYYKQWTLEERKFYYSPFEMKMATHINGNCDNYYGCEFGMKQVSVAPDGKIYPCVQFVKDGISNTEYSIGDIYSGFTENKSVLYSASKVEKETCKDCAINDRCYNTCSCLNWQTTGSIATVSPFLCVTEQMTIRIADKLAEELYALKAPMFMQKHYNKLYPMLSMIEDEEQAENKVLTRLFTS